MNWIKHLLRLLSLFVNTACSASPQPPANRPSADLVEPSSDRLPPVQTVNLPRFLDAIDLAGEIERGLDTFWPSATAELVAANPNKAEAARALTRTLRSQEASQYLPLVAFSLDRELGVLLDSVARRKTNELDRRLSALQASGQAGGEQEQQARWSQMERIRIAAQTKADETLPRLARLARTSEGIALRGLVRKGLNDCLLAFAVPTRYASPAIPLAKAKRCALLTETSAYRTLNATSAGRDLITANTAAWITLMGMMAMAHDPGTSLYNLIPADAIKEAGLVDPAGRLDQP